jgi:hypothetical protein
MRKGCADKRLCHKCTSPLARTKQGQAPRNEGLTKIVSSGFRLDRYFSSLRRRRADGEDAFSVQLLLAWKK